MRNEKGHVPMWRWVLWWTLILVAVFVFYVLFTPVWFSLRVVAWLAEFRARRQP